MPKPILDKAIEERIDMEVIVDAYNSEERAMGWYYYLQDKIKFPFEAKCVTKRSISPLSKGENVTVIDLAPEDECPREIFVEIKRNKEKFAVPLAQLQGIKLEKETQEAIGDWHYWVNHGYEF